MPELEMTVCNEFKVYYPEPLCPILAGWRTKKVRALATEVACLLTDRPEEGWCPNLDHC